MEGHLKSKDIKKHNKAVRLTSLRSVICCVMRTAALLVGSANFNRWMVNLEAEKAF